MSPRMDFNFFFQERFQNELENARIGVGGSTAAFRRALGLYFLVTFEFAQKKQKLVTLQA